MTATGDRVLARGVAPVAPAWLPEDGRTVLAYADMNGRIHVVEADGEQLWSADPEARPSSSSGPATRACSSSSPPAVGIPSTGPTVGL